MLDNNRLRLELAYSLLLTLPGTPMLQYGDEIGMGDDLSLPERECARTPMQWTSEPHGGFSRAKKIVRPVIDDDVYGYKKVNVADQRRDPDSLLNFVERTIRARRECPEISWGNFDIIKTSASEVLAIRYDWRNTYLLTLHNFASHPRKATFNVGAPGGEMLVDVFAKQGHSRARSSDKHSIELEGYGYRWFRVGAVDNALNRSEL
jgi:maltose alpha-D-glucosyltransferase/alpha-amylase